MNSDAAESTSFSTRRTAPTASPLRHMSNSFTSSLSGEPAQRQHGETVSALVRTHEVAYVVVPAHAIVEGERRQIGFDIELMGHHAHAPGTRPTEMGLLPGCQSCNNVWNALRQIAEAALPPSDGLTSASIRPFDMAFHYDGAVAGPLGVELVIEVRHLADGLALVDDQENAFQRAIVSALEKLGASYGRH